MINVNQTVKFKQNLVPGERIFIEGTIKYINKLHHWFSVEYTNAEDRVQRMSFRYDDLGKTVHLVN